MKSLLEISLLLISVIIPSIDSATQAFQKTIEEVNIACKKFERTDR